MSNEGNCDAKVKVALALMESIGEGRINPELVTPDFKAWTPQFGDMPGSLYSQAAARISSVMTGPLRYTPVGITAGGNRVAVEARVVGTLKTGGDYHQEYHFAFVFEGDRVSEIHAYMNTARVRDVLYPVYEAMGKATLEGQS